MSINMRGVHQFGWMDVDPLPIIDRLGSLGTTILEQHMLATSLNWVPPIGQTFSYWLQQMKQLCSQHNMFFGIQCVGLNDSSQLYDPVWKANVVKNVNGLADQWIAANKQVISACQPDFIDIFNEPFGDLNGGNTASPTFLSTYKSFIERAIDEFQSIKPDLICIVQGVPFWKLQSIIPNYIISRNNVIYAVHRYYHLHSYWSMVQWEQDYFNGNLNSAKTGMYNDFLNGLGIQTALNNGLQVWFEEFGCNTDTSICPNGPIYIKDTLDFCINNNIGFCSLNSVGENYTKPYPQVFVPTSPINNLQLNELGQVWSQYLNKKLNLPFRDDFMNLSKWVIINGNWEVV